MMEPPTIKVGYIPSSTQQLLTDRKLMSMAAIEQEPKKSEKKGKSARGKD
eukprot:CAMPEP_0194336400 /NCGR_PEP_ID=MMETSP0171-20130528/72843_1 /TAXON_ID=218684 /ORGANISM="Corethron pennatum, Strain L29A3" /LENGTH=49 /DNA_ID=CAMNT_0039099829 /DNA_START=490 /DNA_END=639 /DNA_ORIENTATION=-